MNQHLPSHVHSAHYYNASGWFLAAIIGWFLLTYVLQLGKGSAFGLLFSNIIYWLLAIDIIPSVAGMVSRLPRPPGFGSIFLFVLLPYLLSGLRIYWLSGRIYWLVKRPRQPRQPPRVLIVTQPYILTGFRLYWPITPPPRKPPRDWCETLALRIRWSIRCSRQRKAASAVP